MRQTPCTRSKPTSRRSACGWKRASIATAAGHDLRAWYKTRCVDDGADSLIIRRTTHAPPRDVESGYIHLLWVTICRGVGKLKVSILGGEVLPLATNHATTELNIVKRWRKPATPTGFEPVLPA